MDEPAEPTKDGIFAQSTFVVVRHGLDDVKIQDIVERIKLHGGEASLDNYPADSIDLNTATHIIAETADFPQYFEAVDLLIPVVKAIWVDVSVASRKLAHPRKFSPDENLFMSSVVATCADLPPGDKDAIAGGILAMGGNYSSKLTSQVTHIVALTMENEKVEQMQKHGLDITVVLPHWFDDCLKLGKKIDEGPYTLPDPEILQAAGGKAPLGKPNKHVAGAVKPDPASETPSLSERRSLEVFKKKKVLLDHDLKISQTLRNILQTVIASSNGKVVDKISEANVLICKYREGIQYNAAVAKKINVGNLAWLYYLIVHDQWTSPYKRLLHYPVPKEALRGFENLKISLSNYSGEARTYLENLINATGAECTKTLKQENTHLITAHKKSEKVAAAEDWNITVVNHLWIEESYAKWEKQAINARYTHFPQKTNLGDVVGQTQIDRNIIEEKFVNHDRNGTDTPQSKRKRPADLGALDASTPGKANARITTGAKDRGSVAVQTPATSRVTGKENVTPSTVGGRKSKEAAAAKLHEMTPDIALFEKERKRRGGVVYGGKRVTDEDRSETSRKRSAEPVEAETVERKGSAKRQRIDSTSIHMHLLITGYKAWVGKPKKEDEAIKRLKELGIFVVDHPAKATHLAAPNILRTPKFLVALAYAPQVLSTQYIEACLEQDEYLEPDDYELVDQDNEEKHGLSLQEVLANAKANQRGLFQGFTLFATEKITGGMETLQAIAEANGASITPYRGRHLTIPSRRAGSTADEDDGPEHDVYLLSNDNAEDRRLWTKFLKTAEDSRRKPQIIIAEWLLSSALRQKIQPLGTYSVDLSI